ncbi:MAG TPA: hypothetical protein VIH99_02230 [Bdellovibrionota bacterium]|jgi:hypothetical protein
MILALIFSLSAYADTPFAQDPLCAETAVQFREVLDKARTLHLKFPQLKGIVLEQNKWFGAVTGEMKAVCEADAKFAREIVKRDYSGILGQCKPAAEAALTDQEVLEHSEASVSSLRQKREDFLVKPAKSGPDSLWNIFERNFKRVDVDALDLLDVPRMAGCELRWMYPRAFLAKKVPFIGCPEAPPGVRLADGDKKDPGLFGVLMNRFSQSIEYNSQRLSRAREAAKASLSRYEACVAQFPGTQNVLLKNVKDTHVVGSGKSVTKGKSKPKGSDITGIQEDEVKRKK